MGIIPSPLKQEEKITTPNGNRKSMEANFAKLKPLGGSTGLKTFTQMRDPTERSNGEKKDKESKKRREFGSNDELDVEDKFDDAEASKDVDAMLSPEDAKRQRELAEGVQKIRVSGCFPISMFLLVG